MLSGAVSNPAHSYHPQCSLFGVWEEIFDGVVVILADFCEGYPIGYMQDVIHDLLLKERIYFD